MFESTTKVQKRSSKGFTLIELLVVVVIVGILAAVALPNFLGQSGKARTTEASAAIDALKSGQEAYVNDAGNYLSTGTGVAAPMTANTTTYAAAANITAGATLASLSGLLGVNLDSNRFLTGGAPNGNTWVVGSTFTNNTDFSVVVTGGAPNTSGAAFPIAGLASTYRKSTQKVFIDGNATQ
jgi:type IV pilus assembly protein PilA